MENTVKLLLKTTIALCIGTAALAACSEEKGTTGKGSGGTTGGGTQKASVYRNPIISNSVPDPTVMRDDDGTFYLYGTEDMGYTPCFKSTDLVNWDFVAFCFNGITRPRKLWGDTDGGIWAPDINKINGKYVLYYSYAEWGGEWDCGIGAAVADKPEGPYTDHGPLFRSSQIGVQNSIDQFYIEEDGRKYMFWGSFHGIYGIELSDDGLSLKPGAEKVQVAGDQMEGTYIHKRGEYYYLFGSNGTCCEGANSTYQVVYGRSKSLFGPYLTKNGVDMKTGAFEILLHSSSTWVGPGHNAEFTTDDNGDDWIIYHAYSKALPGKGRQVLLDKVTWSDDGWPSMRMDMPTNESEIPVFKNVEKQSE